MTPDHPAPAPVLPARHCRPWFSPVSLLAAMTLAGCATAPAPAPDVAAAMPKPAVVQSPAAAAAPAVTQPLPGARAPLAMAPADGSVIAIDPLDPTARVDLDSARANDDLWLRLRSGFRMTDLDNDQVRKWEQWYAKRPDYVQRMTDRGGRYLFHIVNELERRGMPTELALLPFIESAFNPQAMSSAKASGMWQFIPGTGRDFALKQNVFRDDRREVLASTRAALDYLKMLHGMFGDWHLALAAYNWGQGNVQRAVTRLQKAGQPVGYEQLQMPDETRNYVPKLQAVKNIVLRPEVFALALTPLKNHPYFISVGIDRDIDLDRAARLAGLPIDEFKALNPQMNKPVILAAGTPQVLLPYDNANQFVRALGQHKAPLASWTAWVVPRTMKPAQVADQVGMSEAELRQVNNIPPRMLVRAGSTLLVPRANPRQADVDERVADNATLTLAPDLPPFRRVSFKAGRKGDSVAAVAKRYGVSANQVAAWNRSSANARFKPGEAVVVLVPQRTAVAKAGKPVRGGVRQAAAGPRGSLSVAAAPARTSVARKPARPGPAARSPRP
jgi:membrane-bound lytic murein transglycosylase D